MIKGLISFFANVPIFGNLHKFFIKITPNGLALGDVAEGSLDFLLRTNLLSTKPSLN